MNCNYVPTVRNEYGEPVDSRLFLNLLDLLGDGEQVDKLYFGMKTKDFLTWFGEGQRDSNGEPLLMTNDLGEYGFMNENDKFKKIAYHKKGTIRYSENDVINDLIHRGVVNKNQVYGERVLPRPYQGSFSLEEKYSNKMKPETAMSINEINKINAYYRERFQVENDLIKVEPFGKTYKISINPTVLQEINDATKSRVDLFGPPIVRPTVYEGLRMYKQTLVNNLENRLVKIKDLKRRASTTAEHVQLTRTSQEISARITELKTEIYQLTKAAAVSDLNPLVQKDLARLSKLVLSDSQDDITEAKTLVEFYEACSPTNDNHPIFTRDELKDDDGNLKFSVADIAVMESWVTAAKIEGSKLSAKAQNAILERVNNGAAVKATFRGQALKFKDIFPETLKDASTVDMWIMDASNGILSHNGIVPQFLKMQLENAMSRAYSITKHFEEEMLSKMDAAEKIIGELDGGKYKLSKMLFKVTKGVSWDLFFQKDVDDTKTGNLVKRESRIWEDAEKTMLSGFYTRMENNAKVYANDRGKLYRETLAETKRKRDWYDTHSVIVDMTKLPEIQDFINNSNEFDFLKPFMTNRFTAVLNVGANHRTEIIAKQKELLYQFKYTYEAKIQNAVDTEGVANESLLSDRAKADIQTWFIQHSPTHGYENVNGVMYTSSNGTVSFPVHSTLDYNVKFPRKKLYNRGANTFGSVTGYYDANFEIIDQHPELYEFHDVAKRLWKYTNSVLPASIQKKVLESTMGLSDKVMADILFDPTKNWFTKFSEVGRQLYEKIWEQSNWIKVQNTEDGSNPNLVTGEKERRVNYNALTSGRAEIENRFTIEKIKFINAYNNRSGSIKLKGLKRRERIAAGTLNQESIDLLASYLGVEPTIAAIKTKMQITGSDIPVGRIINNYVTNQVVSQSTTNLPRTMMLFSSLASEYAARNEVKPFIDATLEYYKKIKTPLTQNTDETVVNTSSGQINKKDLRVNAIQQINAWYERAVLGDSNDKQMSIGKEKKFTKEQKKQIREIKEQMARLGSTPEDIALLNQLNTILDNMGYNSAFSKRILNVLHFIRFKGLGYNMKSALTNYMEGQVANEIMIHNELYYPSDGWYETTRLVRLARRKTFTSVAGKTLAHPDAKFLTLTVNRYNVLQDSRNEFQKAGIKTSFTLFEKLDPMMLNQSVEYLNQAPIMAHALRHEKINDGNGNETNVWDAFDHKTGNLKPEWATEENVSNWENMTGDQYNDFKNKLTKCIVDTHGDYDKLRGNLAKQHLVGKALMMFKGWLPRALYMRFGVEQIDIETGRKHRGRYRSHTAASAGVHGAIIGASILTPFGPLGVLGIPIGFAVGTAWAGLTSDSRSDLGYLAELGFVTKTLVRKMIGIPVNRGLSKDVVHMANAQELSTKLHAAAGKRFDETDIKNFNGLMAEMAVTLGWLALVLLTKVVLFDEDDDDEDPKRVAHNLLVNRFMAMSQQATMYLNIFSTWQDNVAQFAALRFLTDVGVLINDAGKVLTGDNADRSSDNKGNSKFIRQAKKTFLPSPLKPGLGFGSDAKRQIQSSQYDSWFKSDYTNRANEIQGDRDKLRSDLKEEGVYTSKQIEKIINTRYPTLHQQMKTNRPVYKVSPEEMPEFKKRNLKLKQDAKQKILEDRQKVAKKKAESGN